MKKQQDLKGTFTFTIRDSKGNELNTIIKKGNIDERKLILDSVQDDEYFTIAEQFIKNNYVSGDNLFADEEALFGACLKLREFVKFDSAKQVETPADVNADFSIEAIDENGNTLLAHYSKPSVKIKKQIFSLVARGATEYAIGEVILHSCFVSGDSLFIDKEVFTSAAIIAAAKIEYNEAIIKKN